MTMINQPAAPGGEPEEFPTPSLPGNQPAPPGQEPGESPTPSLPGNQPAAPGQGPVEFPTPSLPGNQPAAPGQGPVAFPTPSLPSQPPVVIPSRFCPVGYRTAIVQSNQSFTDLLLENNVSYQALRSANPNIPTTRIAPGTRYCAPPPRSRRLCGNGTTSYIMELGEDLYTLTQTIGVSPATLLFSNPTLAPSDFVPGRVICIP